MRAISKTKAEFTAKAAVSKQHLDSRYIAETSLV
jgi:hypothetical protein